MCPRSLRDGRAGILSDIYATFMDALEWHYGKNKSSSCWTLMSFKPELSSLLRKAPSQSLRIYTYSFSTSFFVKFVEKRERDACFVLWGFPASKIIWSPWGISTARNSTTFQNYFFPKQSKKKLFCKKQLAISNIFPRKRRVTEERSGEVET